jgi:hypothetical protein
LTLHATARETAMRIAWPELVAVAAIGLAAIESADKSRGIAVADAGRLTDGEPRIERPAAPAASSWPRARTPAPGASDHAFDRADPARLP